jgi:tRNA (cytidine32/uridine32-2'-O)-methyltransferase
MISVAIVDAQTPGNVGTIARAMKNFGLSDLYLVDPPDISPDGDAYGFAGRAREDVLPNARTVSFDHLVENFHTVGCTAIPNTDERRHIRYPFKTPRELADTLAGVETDTVVVFGRENVGLHNEELERIDEICSIPASAEYPVLNLGQAATIVLYELRTVSLGETGTQQPTEIVRAPQKDIDGLYDQFGTFLESVEIVDEQRSRMERLWRRLLGRAHPTKREVSTLRGVFRRAENGLREDENNR